MRLFLGCMYSVEKTAPVPSKEREKVGHLIKLEKNPRFHKAFRQFKAVGRIHLPDVRIELRVFGGRHLCQTPAQELG